MRHQSLKCGYPIVAVIVTAGLLLSLGCTKTDSLEIADADSNLNKFSFSLKSLKNEVKLAEVLVYFQAKSDDEFLRRGYQGKQSFSELVGAEEITDGSTYTFSPFPSATLSQDLSWTENPLNNRSWQFSLHGFTWMDQLLAAHAEYGEDRFLDKAVALTLDWIEDNTQESPACEMSWHDHATALRLDAMLFFWEYWRTQASDNREAARKLLRSIYEHGEVLLKPSFYSKHTNHGFDQSYSLVLLSLVLPEFDRAATWRRVGEERLTDESLFAFTSEGIHKENSPAYHFLMTRRLLKTRRLFEGYGEKEATTSNTFDKALHFAKFLRLPGGQLPLMGDTATNDKGHAFVPNWASKRDEIMYSFSDGREGTAPKETCVVVPESGYAIFRDKWHPRENFDDAIHFTLKMGSISSYHFHDDVLTFSLYGRGERWIVDGGLYKYQYDDPFRKYVEGRFAHNVVIVDDSSFSTKKKVIPSTCKDSVIRDDLAYCIASYPIGKTVKHTREVLFLKPARFLVKDTLTALDGKQHNYKLIFHIDRDKTVKSMQSGFDITSMKDQSLSLSIRSYSDSDSLYDVKGQKTPHYQGWAAYEKFSIDPVHAVGFEKTTLDHEFRTVVMFTEEPSFPEPEEGIDAGDNWYGKFDSSSNPVWDFRVYFEAPTTENT
ncbi:heparinase II/III family protein [Candidatus Hydrogenedentota bacterium]